MVGQAVRHHPVAQAAIFGQVAVGADDDLSDLPDRKFFVRVLDRELADLEYGLAGIPFNDVQAMLKIPEFLLAE